MKTKIPSFVLLFSLLFMLSCADEKQKNHDVESVRTQILEQSNEEEMLLRIKKIFLSLPSPLELTLLFKKEGVVYNQGKLHRTSKRKEYITSYEKALNLGVYGADLSYSGLFGRHESAIEYFAASQILAEDLGIGRTFQKQFVSRLEENAGNKDTLLQVVSDFFLVNDRYLKNQNQQNISIYILVGGWIEGMYLGTQMVEESTNVEGVRAIIVDQKNSLHNLIVLMQSLKQNTKSESLLNRIGELEEIYLRSSDNDILSEKSFQEIKTKVASIRESII